MVRASKLGTVAGLGLFTNQMVGRRADMGPYRGASLSAREVAKSKSQYISSFVAPPPLAKGHTVTFNILHVVKRGVITRTEISKIRCVL